MRRSLLRCALPLAACASLLAFASTASAAGPSFVDPTASVPSHVTLGALDYVGPFATLTAGANAIHIGDESNVQDSVRVDASRGNVDMGEMVILAHGAAVNGDAELGEHGVCPHAEAHCPSFVGFNSLVDGANIEKDAMVLHLARVAPGITVKSGKVVLSGKNVTTQAQADDPALGKVALVGAGERAFMHGVIEVNVAFATAYTTLKAADPTNVTGINYDPDTFFNPGTQLPSFHGVETRRPNNRNRVIGEVALHDTLSDFNEEVGSRVSLRADEGYPFHAGSIESMGNSVTWHALEHTHIDLGDEANYGSRSIVHGGPNAFHDTTITGADFSLGFGAVYFRSKAGKDVTIGRRTLIQNSDLPSGTTVRAHQIIVNSVDVGDVEW